jgi:Arc/MetJ family transcription regulator
MRTNIDIDAELMQQAMAATGATTKKAAVEAALRMVVHLKRQGDAIEGLWGIATWVGPDEDWFAVDPLAPKSGEPGHEEVSPEMGTSVPNQLAKLDPACE